jgi:hypothetical protein
MWFQYILVYDIDTGHIITILPAILYGCKTWSLTHRREQDENLYIEHKVHHI